MTRHLGEAPLTSSTLKAHSFDYLTRQKRHAPKEPGRCRNAMLRQVYETCSHNQIIFS
jgi:hypothetical protein